MSKSKKILFVFIILVTFLWGIGLGYFIRNKAVDLISQKDNNSSSKSSLSKTSQSQNTNISATSSNSSSQPGHVKDKANYIEFNANVDYSKAYFNNGMIIVAKNNSGEQLVYTNSFNRKRNSDGSYLHSYSTEFKVDNNTRKHSELKFTNSSANVIPTGFLTGYSNQIADDTSPREKYDISMSVENSNLSFSILGLRGDFLINSDIDLTQIINTAGVTVTLDGKEYKGNALIVRKYTPNHSKFLTIVPPPRKSHFLVMWDNEENFYMIDSTTTEAFHPVYKSHTWVIYKNNKDEYTKKSFTADIKFNANDNIPINWTIALPEIYNAQLNLEVDKFSNENKDCGSVKGSVSYSENNVVNTSSISGFFVYMIAK